MAYPYKVRLNEPTTGFTGIGGGVRQFATGDVIEVDDEDKFLWKTWIVEAGHERYYGVVKVSHVVVP